MSRRLAALVLALACCASGAQAESWQVPQPYMIPLPPTIEPNFEVGLRYWASEGTTSITNAGSRLSYDDLNGNSGEFVWSARNAANTFAKGFVGGGGVSGGTLDGDASRVGLSETTSNVDGGGLVYGTIDLGQRFTLMDGEKKFFLSPFVGFNFYQESAKAYGARCSGGVCGADTVEVPFSTEVIKNEANWASLRLGGEARLKLWDRLTLIADAAFLPVAYVWNEASANLNPELGSSPNIESKGTGWGYQIEAEARYDFGTRWSAGAGFRYWYAQVSDGKTDFVNLEDPRVDLSKLSSKRLGVFGDVSYRF